MSSSANSTRISPYLQGLKSGAPETLVNYTVDIHHSPHYAVGYMMKQINPRAGMVTHLNYDNDMAAETVAGVRAHWDGLFLFGAPDVAVVNVTKDAIWSRMAALPEASTVSPGARNDGKGGRRGRAASQAVRLPEPPAAARAAAGTGDAGRRDRSQEVLSARRGSRTGDAMAEGLHDSTSRRCWGRSSDATWHKWMTTR